MKAFINWLKSIPTWAVNAAKSFWNWLVWWFERGDLVPLLVVVSSVHYMSILAGKDVWPVAVAIGILVDLGHFRTIRAAFRYEVKPKHKAARFLWIAYRRTIYPANLYMRWAIALAMTGISLAYHQRYYNDWWLSAPIPFLIAALAWLQKVDRSKPAQSEAKKQNAPIHADHAEPMRASSAHLCAQCGEPQNSQQALAAHMRWKHANGNGKVHSIKVN